MTRTGKWQTSESQQLAQLAEGRIIDAQEELEMFILDEDVAEEGRVGVIELEDVKPRLAILEVRSIPSFFFGTILTFGKHTEGNVAGGSPMKDSLV